MKTLRMPGFSAEASLHEASRCYFVTGRSGAPAGIIPTSHIPQLVSSCWTICGGDPDCVHCCQCVRRGGDPSQCCF